MNRPQLEFVIEYEKLTERYTFNLNFQIYPKTCCSEESIEHIIRKYTIQYIYLIIVVSTTIDQ